MSLSAALLLACLADPAAVRFAAHGPVPDVGVLRSPLVALRAVCGQFLAVRADPAVGLADRSGGLTFEPGRDQPPAGSADPHRERRILQAERNCSGPVVLMNGQCD